jgi:Arc/MetJ family transcription regulator
MSFTLEVPMAAAARRSRRRSTDVDVFDAVKARRARELARAQKLIGGPKRRVLNARLDENLVAAAKARTGITSDTELVELALVRLAVEDDFGAWLLAQGGRLDPDFDLEL